MSLSFGFKKKIESKLVSTNNKDKDAAEVDYLKAVDGKVIVSNTPKNTEKKDLVIPLIKRNVYRKVEKNCTQKEQARDSLDDEAAKEIIKDSKQFLEKSNDETENFDDVAIPLLLKNKVPEGFETDDKMDVSLRPDGATEAEYDQVPVAAFGMAVLRGMGWTPEVGIGKTFKQNTKTLEQKIRPKGLGLGADVMAPQSADSKKSASENSVSDHANGDEILPLVKGTNVLITRGSHKNKYGTILGIDADTDRIIVKMAIGGKNEQISTNCLRAVSSKEFKCNAKDLSRLSKAFTGESITIIDNDRRVPEDIKRKKVDDDKQDSSISEKRRKKDTDTEEASSKKYRKRSSTPPKKKSVNVVSWVRPQIRVRIVDKKYRKGRYYKEKVTVEDVLGRGKCCCKTDDGKILDDITDSMLETVIPKSSSDAYVIIVHSRKGRHNGKLAKILEKDKIKCEAMLQLIEDRSVVVKTSFQDMCEFTGDPEMNDMF